MAGDGTPFLPTVLSWSPDSLLNHRAPEAELLPPRSEHLPKSFASAEHYVTAHGEYLLLEAAAAISNEALEAQRAG